MSNIAALLDQARHRSAHYRKRQTIYDEGDAASAFFRVVSGCVRLQINGAQGRRQIVGFMLPGDIFGLCVEERASAAEAATDVELIRYSLDSVLRRSTHSTELVFELMRAANTQFNELAHHVETVAHRPAADRVVWFFTWLADRQGCPGEPVALPMSRRDIGDFLAISPETLSRVIADLEAQGTLIRRGPRAFTLRSHHLPVDLESAGRTPPGRRTGPRSDPPGPSVMRDPDLHLRQV